MGSDFGPAFGHSGIERHGRSNSHIHPDNQECVRVLTMLYPYYWNPRTVSDESSGSYDARFRHLICAIRETADEWDRPGLFIFPDNEWAEESRAAGIEDLLNDLAGSLSAPHAYVRLATLRALQEMGSAAAPAIPGILPLLYDPAPFIPCAAIAAIHAIRPSWSLVGTGLVDLLESLIIVHPFDWYRRYLVEQVLRLLQYFHGRAVDAVPAILRILQHSRSLAPSDWPRRWRLQECFLALARIGALAAHAIPEIQWWLDSEHSALAAFALSCIDASRAANLCPVIMNQLSDWVENAHSSLAADYGSDTQTILELQATQSLMFLPLALERIGKPARGALPILQKCLAFDCSIFSRVAERAFQQIYPNETEESAFVGRVGPKFLRSKPDPREIIQACLSDQALNYFYETVLGAAIRFAVAKSGIRISADEQIELRHVAIDSLFDKLCRNPTLNVTDSNIAELSGRLVQTIGHLLLDHLRKWHGSRRKCKTVGCGGLSLSTYGRASDRPDHRLQLVEEIEIVRSYITEYEESVFSEFAHGQLSYAEIAVSFGVHTEDITRLFDRVRKRLRRKPCGFQND